MLVKAVLVVLQTVLFLILFGIGSFLPGFTAFPAWQVQTGPGRVFIADGIVFAVIAYFVILGVEAARRRIRGPGALTTLALVLAVALGFAMKLGFKSL